MRKKLNIAYLKYRLLLLKRLEVCEYLLDFECKTYTCSYNSGVGLIVQ